MPRLTSLRHLGAALFGVALLVLGSAPPAAAQTTTGTIRGYVRDSSGAPFGGAMVEAKNVDNGALRTTTSKEDGSYVLPGLVPGVYDLTVRHIGSQPSTRRLAVQIGATLIADFVPTSQAVEVAGVTVQGVAPTQETRTSEIATNVTQQQVQQLPTPSRNFLDLAALAPGVIPSPDFVNQQNRNFSAGSQGPGQTNVFIDGTSLKDNLTGGETDQTGLAGQDASRGNPFPRNAIAEYRVITQNFKAEYQNASSAIITTTTKSGGNTWTGDAFFTYQDKNLVALDSISRAHNPTNDKSFKPDYSRYLLGGSVGGPLIRDKLFFFGSFEGNYQNRDATVTIDTTGTGAFPAVAGYNLPSFNGNFGSPFRESLFFGKLTYNVGEHSTAELSFSARHETDVRDFGNGPASFQGANDYRNNVTFGTLKYTYATGPWLNEAMATYQNFTRNPTPATPGLPHQTFFLPSGAVDIGSNVSSQDFVQKGLNLRNDVTYTGFRGMGDHVFKGGVNINLLNFNIDKSNNETPQFFYADAVNCNPTCDTIPEHYLYRNPYTMTWATGSPFLKANDTQIGAYLQDDWSPTSRLTLNLGVRWDFESNMFNTDYVTPQNVEDSIVKYNNTLQHPIDPATYFTDGTQRKRFYGAFQPRVGFSYALDQANKTTLFGGFGVYYDRTFFDMSVDEKLKLSRPFYTIHFADPDSVKAGQVAWNNSYLTTDPTVLNGLITGSQAAGQEVWLIANNAKVPYSHQWNLGVRHFFGDVLVSVAYVGQRSYDGLVLNWANLAMKPDGTCCVGGDFGHGFTNIIYSTNSVRTWYDAVNVTLNRPYTRNAKDWGWGGGFSYTSGSRYVSGVDNVDDEFAFPQDQFIKKHPVKDEKSRLVANWIMDVPYAWGIQFGGLLTLGTGPRVDIGSRFNGNGGPFIPGGFSPPQYPFIIPGAWAFRELDLRLTKEFPSWSGGRLAVNMDIFNVLNTANYNFDGNSGHPNGLASDPRKMQLGVDYSF